MKTIFVSLLASALAFNAVAQNPEQALIRVKYVFSHMTDTNKRENFYKENMMVVAGKNASVFLSYDNALYDMEAMSSLVQQHREQAGVEVKTIKMPQRKKSTSRSAVFYYANEGKMFIQEQLGQMYLVERDADKIDWKITMETRNIEGLNCKKATTTYRGRNWTAWFTEDLPFATGPWILVGLPGLIIEANDEKKEVLFEFAGLEKVDKNEKKAINGIVDGSSTIYYGNTKILIEDIIELPAKAVRATPKEMNRLKETMKKDPDGFIKTQMAAMGFGGLKPVAGGTRTTPPAAPVMNNPIDKSKP